MKQEANWDELFRRIAQTVREWREENPRATLTEIEKAVDKELSGVRVKMVEELALQAKSRDIAGMAEADRPRCPQCGGAVIANGRGKRALTTAHEQQLEIERSKAYCLECEVSFFPPG